MSELIERVARALAMRDAKEQFPDLAEKMVNTTTTIHDEERAQAAIAEILKDYAIVPKEPTEAMLEGFGIHKARVAENYRVMIEAAPKVGE